MHSTYDVLIIGGGIIGFSIAYQLTKAGMKPLVLDRGDAGQASRAAGGMLGAQVEMEQPGPLFELGVKSRSLFPALQEELIENTGIDLELNRSGMMRIAISEEDREELLQRKIWQEEKGYPAQWMEEEEVRRTCHAEVHAPWGGLFLPQDFQVRSPRYLQALIEASVRRGAIFLQEEEVVGFTRSGDRITGVQTLNGTFSAAQIVIAAGSWSGHVASLLGLELPVQPEKGQSLLVDTTPHVTELTLFAPGTYLIPKANRQTYLGATSESVGFAARPSLYNVKTLSHSATAILPELENSTFAGVVTGFRPTSHDGLPYMGWVPGYRGLMLATGHWRNGILFSAITGILMAELIQGKQPSIDLSPFSPGRLVSVKK